MLFDVLMAFIHLFEIAATALLVILIALVLVIILAGIELSTWFRR